MIKYQSSYLSLSILILLSSGILLYFYQAPLTNPNKFLFSDSGDGIKNYFTYSSHIKNDTSLTEFGGMNYPYGEYFIYTDCQPALSTPVKLISGIFPSISGVSIGILNFLLLFSLLISSFIIYLILIEFEVGRYYAIFAAISIMLLSPQLFRITGHLGLGWTFFIPLTWYLLIRFMRSDKKSFFTVLLIINNLFWFFVHPYLGIMTAVFLVSFWLMVQVFNYSSMKWQKLTDTGLLIAAVFPLILFRLFVFFTDTHSGRSDNPGGFFLYNAEPDDIFLPHHPPLRPLLNRFLYIDQEWEAWSYVGIVTGLVLLFLIIRGIMRLLKCRKASAYSVNQSNKLLYISFAASLILLLFAFGIPFKQVPALLDWLPFFKQFRTTGRFAWFFYYTATSFSLIFLYQMSSRLIGKARKIRGYALLVIPLSIYLMEGIPYHIDTARSIQENNNMFAYQNLDKDHLQIINHIDPGKYQAILPLPFFYYGSGSYSRPRPDPIMQSSFFISYHTGLPLIANNATRGSVPESRNIVQLISPPYYKKMIEAEFPIDKPVLILRDNENLTKYEQAILNRANSIFKTGKLEILELSPDLLFRNTAKSEIEAFQRALPGFQQAGTFLTSNPDAFLYYNGFEKNKNSLTFRGTSSYLGDKRGINIFAFFGPGYFDKGKEYTVSIWMHNAFPDALNLWFRFIVEETDPVTANTIQTVCLPEESEVINGDWSLIELPFTVTDTSHEIRILCIGKDDSYQKLIADDLLIRESGVDVFKITGHDGEHIDELFKNNHQIKL